jgi:hypothetical protein
MPTAGSWPEWVEAGFTSLAFVIAALSYRRSVNTRREAQARLVYSKITEIRFYEPGAQFDLLPNGAQHGAPGGGAEIVQITDPESGSVKSRYLSVEPVGQVTAVIHNGSNELIGPAKLQLVDTGPKGVVFAEFAALTGVVEPESDHVLSFVFPNPHHPGQPGLGTTLIFRDSSGQWWRRYRAESIEAVHDDPENAAPTPAERAIYAANARAMGATPRPEPRVSRRVRLYRKWRKTRGKSPIP